MLITVPQKIEGMNKSEKYILNKLKNLYMSQKANVYLYLEPKIKNLTPDFILIDPLRGVVIIEVKSWDIDYINTINSKEIKTVKNEKLENPAYKARRYFNTTQSLFKFYNKLIDNRGNLKFKLHSIIAFTELGQDDAIANKITQFFDHYPARILYKENISKLTLDKLFNNSFKEIDKSIIDNIKVAIFPEIKIAHTYNKNKQTIDEQMKVLDVEQNRIAKKIPFGHYMITGIPGSGKSIVLLSRALYISRLYPQWKILIVTYNKSLTSQLKLKIESVKKDFEYHDISLDNIKLTTFHSLAMKYGKLSPSDFSKEKQDRFWKEILPNYAIQNAKPYYDMILVDEYQDFYKNWFELLIKLLKKYKDENGEEYINLFLAGDRLQSIYNPNEINWKQDIGLDMRGRATLLQSSYRVTKEHIHFGLSLLQKDKKYNSEVEKFYKDGKDILLKNMTKNSIKLIEGDYEDISEYIQYLLKDKFSYKDILLLAPTKRIYEKVKNLLPINIQKNIITSKEAVDDKMIFSTYHSSKGIESKITIVVDTDRIEERKLLYVASTRASHKLILHSFDFEKSEISKDIKDIAKEHFNLVSEKSINLISA